MSDEIDIAQEREEFYRQQAIDSRKPFVLDPGVPGDCDLCGEWSGRPIAGACAPCRDRHGRE